MVAILSHIFTGPNISAQSVLGMVIMVLGGIVCIFAKKIKSRLSGKAVGEGEEIPLKLCGLAVVIIGLITTIYLKG